MRDLKCRPGSSVIAHPPSGSDRQRGEDIDPDARMPIPIELNVRYPVSPRHVGPAGRSGNTTC
jgi:hypothetical protein